MKQLNILNIYQLNIYQTLTLMFKTKQRLTPNIFLDKFKTINHNYLTTYSTNNFTVPKQQLKISNFCISTHGQFLTMFQKAVKNKRFC